MELGCGTPNRPQDRNLRVSSLCGQSFQKGQWGWGSKTGKPTGLSESSQWATGTQLHWRHLSGRVERALDLSHRGPKRLNSVSTNSQLSMVEGPLVASFLVSLACVSPGLCRLNLTQAQTECRGPRNGDGWPWQCLLHTYVSNQGSSWLKLWRSFLLMGAPC